MDGIERFRRDPYPVLPRPISPPAEFLPKGQLLDENLLAAKWEPHDILAAGIMTKCVIAPILTCLSPLFLLAITIHYFCIAIFYRLSPQTYFATYFILGINQLDQKKLDENRSEIQRLCAENTFESMQSQYKSATAQLNNLDQKARQNNLPLSEQPKVLEPLLDAGQIRRHVEKSFCFEFEEISVKRSEAKIDGLAIRSFAMSQKPIDQQKWIIFFPGRATCYETWYQTAYELAKTTETNVLIFNYRGIGRSGRTKLDDATSAQELTKSAIMLEQDAKSVVDHLLAKGINKENILNYGYSLGGAAASTQTDIALCSDRSFRSSYRVTTALFWVPIFRDVIALIAWIFWGYIDAFANVQKIQDNKKPTFIITSQHDMIIDVRHASLFSAFQEYAPKETPTTLMLIHDTEGNFWTRLKKRVLAHKTKIPSSSLKELIKPWLNTA